MTASLLLQAAHWIFLFKPRLIKNFNFFLMSQQNGSSIQPAPSGLLFFIVKILIFLLPRALLPLLQQPRLQEPAPASPIEKNSIILENFFEKIKTGKNKIRTAALYRLLN